MSALSLRFLACRLWSALVVLVGVSALIFVATEILPGDIAVAILGRAATPEAVAALREALGADQPALHRYLDWIGGVLVGDFGQSLTTGRDVARLVTARLELTASLAGMAVVIAVPLSVSAAFVAALYRGRPLDTILSGFALLTACIPEFFIGYCLILVFAVHLGWFPSLAMTVPGAAGTGDGFLSEIEPLVLPAVTLGLVLVSHTMRLARAAICDLLEQPFIEMARFKGVRGARLILWHVVPGLLPSVAAVLALGLAYALAGAVIVEVVFAYPGLGQLLVDHVLKRDVPVVQACALVLAACYVLLNFLADLTALRFDPRLPERVAI
ncbi:MAG: ABC transporter permease subunit [Alphaproteobacteria bacterium]|jgi:peptide/nickel transport system permease protein|nr:ABC transporter permease subunit [Alphaproteobacteria bacterium]